MDLTLYRAVGSLNRVALGDLSTSEFYAASADPRTGIITLQPVNIVDGTRRTEPSPAPGPVLDGGDDTDAPFDPDDA
jgi:hypothetical protein